MLTYLKTAIFTVAILILGLIGYILFAFDSHYESQLALDAFLKGDNKKAEAIVKQLPLDEGYSHLYLAYLYRARQEMPLSDEHLALAAKGASGPLALEIALNQAYNGYLTGDKQALQKGLSTASTLNSDSTWIAFFTSLDRNEPPSQESNVYLSPWMQKAFDSTFTPFWIILQKARSEIAQGQTLQARQRLEQITSTHASEAAELELLVGLSYLKEAEAVPTTAATPYFKLAFGYFGRVPLQSQRFSHDRALLLKQIDDQIAMQIEQGGYQEIAFYTTALESLNAPPETYLIIRHSALRNILEVIPIDTGELTLTLPQIDIWLKVEQDAKARRAFALALLSLAEQLWHSHTEKALQLSLTAVSIPALSEQRALQKRMELSIQNAYAAAPAPMQQAMHKTLTRSSLAHLVPTSKPVKQEPTCYLVQLSLKNYEDYRNALASPHPRLFLQIGDTCYSLGQPCQGRFAVLRAIELARPLPESQEYLKIALPLAANIELGLGLEVEAWRHLAEYYKLFPKEMEGRVRYARLSMDLQRFDLALAEWKTLEEAGRLSDDDRVSYIASLVRTDQADLAQAKAKSWKSSLKPAHQLEIAHWLLNSEDIPATLDTRSKIALLSLYRIQGEFEQAEALANTAKAQLSLSPEGLLALAELQADLSNRKGALQFAQQALILDQHNRSIKAFLEPYATLSDIESRLEQIIGQLLLFPESPSLQLKQAQALIDLGIAQNGNIPALRRASLILDGLLKTDRDLPRLYYLKGETAILLNNPRKSREAFLKAISLDPSYVQACQYLGMVCETLQKPDEALQAMQQAIKYAPNNAEAWSELALLQERQSLDQDALQSWKQAAKFHARDSMAYYQIGRMSCRIKDVEGAHRALAKALEINPQNPKALKLLLILSDRE
ncbi:MAG: tetratricopeptide repeat protein [Parachlamydia sp.]|nr:tetratricopeptide repeat protein [Parachlamydia sp.]